jgi:hypothetical protein
VEAEKEAQSKSGVYDRPAFVDDYLAANYCRPVKVSFA